MSDDPRAVGQCSICDMGVCAHVLGRLPMPALPAQPQEPAVPGPWRLVEDRQEDGSDGFVIFAADGTWVCDGYDKSHGELLRSAPTLLAERDQARASLAEVEAERDRLLDIVRGYYDRMLSDPNTFGCADEECDQETCLDRRARAALRTGSGGAGAAPGSTGQANRDGRQTTGTTTEGDSDGNA